MGGRTDCQKSDWFYESVKTVFLNEIITGMTTTTFDPSGMLTRAQCTTILYRMAGAPEVQYRSVFSDVPQDSWFTDAVIWANEQKIIASAKILFFI